MYRKFTVLFALFIYCSNMYAQAIRPYILLGNNFFHDSLYNYVLGGSKKTYILRDKTDIGICRILFIRDMEKDGLEKPFRYFIAGGTYMLDDKIGKAISPSSLLNYLLDKSKEAYSIMIEDYSVDNKIDINNENELLETFQDFPDKTLFIWHGGDNNGRVKAINNSLFLNTISKPYQSAFERAVNLFFSPYEFIIGFKNGKGHFFFKRRNIDPNINITKNIVGGHIQKEIKDFTEWWKEKILGNFKDNIVLSGDDCDEIAASTIKQKLTEETIDNYMEGLLLAAIWNNDEPLARNCLAMVNLKDYDYKLKPISLLNALISNNYFNVSLLQKLKENGYNISEDLSADDTWLCGLFKKISQDDLPGSKLKEAITFARQLLSYRPFITKELMQEARSGDLLEILLHSDAFYETKWNYNDLMSMLPEPSRKIAGEIICEDIVRICKDSIADAHLFYALFDEEAWLEEQFFNYIFYVFDLESYINFRRTRLVVIRLLKCGLPHANKLPALFAAIALGNYGDKDYKNVVLFLSKKYDRYHIPLPYYENETAFVKAIEWNNMNALESLLSTFLHRDYCRQQIFDALTYAIVKGHQAAVKKIILYQGFEDIINEEEKVKFIAIAKEKKQEGIYALLTVTFMY